MKKAPILSVLTLLLFLVAGCRKEQKQFSIWYIDSMKHSSNNVTATVGKAIAILGCNDADDKWDISFYVNGYLPSEGQWPILSFKPYGNDPSKAYIFFYKGTTVYAVSPSNSNTLQATQTEGKVSYMLPPTWFIRMQNNDPGNPIPTDTSFTYTTDSVLISGTFNVP